MRVFGDINIVVVVNERMSSYRIVEADGENDQKERKNIRTHA
jgi:hypothetical protein